MGGWNIGIFECSHNLSTFFFACCVPGGFCCIQMVNASFATREGGAWKFVCILDCCLPVIGCVINRVNLRKSLDIKDSIFLDCFFWLYCPCCAVTQEYIETMDKKNSQEKGISIWNAIRNI